MKIKSRLVSHLTSVPGICWQENRQCYQSSFKARDKYVYKIFSSKRCGREEAFRQAQEWRNELKKLVDEGKSYEDKRMVAGVFLNRLEIGMALQSDPTVNYITLKVTDNPLLDDISIDNPYNTYKNAGLPPGPVANPGLDDIRAVIDPIDHNYFFFINSQEGEMIFSKDFEEHKANRVKYNQ